MSKRLAEERQRKIDEMIQKLTSTDPAERKEAALYLGEAAAGEALDALVELYENDEDRGVRKAAAYALGMFKSVDRELRRGEKSKARVVALLEQVENQGKIGRRANRGALFSSVLMLLVLFGLLVALNWFWQDADRRGMVMMRVNLITATPDQRRELSFVINQQIQNVRADASTLARQFEAVRTGGTVDCTVFLNNPAALQPDQFATSPELGSIAVTLNSILVDLISSRSRYDSVCSGQLAALTTADVEPFLPTLAGALGRLNEVEAAFNSQFSLFVPTNTPLPTPTVDPFFTPSATPATPNPTSHLNALYELADSMTRPNGGAQILETYWNDVIRTGDTDGCRGRVPNIPADYELPQIDRDTSPELAQAVDLINGGLEAVRNGWINFTFACNSQNLRSAAGRELPLIQAALASFRTAIPLLDSVRASGG